MKESVENVKVGVGVIVIRDKHVLLGERTGSLGDGMWALPGGHLKFGETIENCAEREVFEETGLTIGVVKHVAFTNDFFETEHKHYVTLFVSAICMTGEPNILEPEKCKQWKWFNWSALPEPLFLPLATFVKKNKELFENT